MSKVVKHVKFSSGLKKEVPKVAKPRFDLIPVEVLERIAKQFAHGAEKYGENNWRLGRGKEIEIFKQAAHRHLFQWANNVDDGEDHAAALLTDVIMYEWLKTQK